MKWRKGARGEIEAIGYEPYIGGIQNKKAPIVDERFMIIEPVYCEKFGCGKKLSLIEKLAGKVCLKHQVGNRRYGYY